MLIGRGLENLAVVVIGHRDFRADHDTAGRVRNRAIVKTLFMF
jgi:hypothetical protein